MELESSGNIQYCLFAAYILDLFDCLWRWLVEDALVPALPLLLHQLKEFHGVLSGSELCWRYFLLDCSIGRVAMAH